MTKKKGNPTDTTVTIDPKKIQQGFNDVFYKGIEYTLHAFSNGRLKTEDAKELHQNIGNGRDQLPAVNISATDDGSLLMNISMDGTLLHQDFVAVEKPKPEKDVKVPKMKETLAHLDKHVIGQKQAKRICTRAIKLHFERCFGEPTTNGTELTKQNVIIHGPSGCGKTEIWRVLGKYLDIPVFIEDATQLSPSGYKGRNVEDMAREIWLQCEKNMAKAETSVIVLDEWCKMGAMANGSSVAEFRQSVINDLLKFIEGGKIPFKEYANAPDTHFLDTSNILVVAMGAFEGIESLFSEQGSMGFGAERLQTQTPSRNDITDKVGVEELSKWGFNKQILGRFPIRTYVCELTEEELVDIQLNVPNSIYHQWIELFERLDSNVQLTFTPPAIKHIAQKAIKNGTGARELVGEYGANLGSAYDEAEMDENISSVKVYVEKGELKVQYGYGSSALETLCKHIPVENSEA